MPPTTMTFGAVLLCCASAFAQQPSPSDVDRSAAEHHFEPMRHSLSLHNREVFPDGAKGFTIPTFGEVGVKLTRLPSPFTSEEDYRIHQFYCAFDAIVLAKNLNSVPELMSTKSGIYTVSHFVVLQTLKSDGIAQDQTIVTYRIGGEVVDEGETLRIDVHGAPPYKPGDTYLLLLTRDKPTSTLQFAAHDYGTILLKNGRIDSNVGMWQGFLALDTLH